MFSVMTEIIRLSFVVRLTHVALAFHFLVGLRRDTSSAASDSDELVGAMRWKT